MKTIQLKPIETPEALDAELAKIDPEQCTHLALVGNRYGALSEIRVGPDWQTEHAFRLRFSLEKLPNRVHELAHLSALCLAKNIIGEAGAEYIAQLSKLTQLDLSKNSIGDIGAEHITQLNKLTQLDLSENSISDAGAKHIAQLNKLTQLDLSGNSISDIGAEHITQLNKLTQLDLSENSIGDIGAEHITQLNKLTQLKLSYNRIGEAGAKHIAELKQLSKLELHHCKIGDNGAKHIAQLNKLTQLDLSENSISDAGAKHIAQLNKLIKLDLSENSICDAGVKHITQLNKLTKLNLSNNNIGDTGTKHIAQLNKLTQLNLGDNSIGYSGAKHIAELKQLNQIDLRRCTIGDTGVKHIAELKQLTRLILYRNSIGETGISTLMDALCDPPASEKIISLVLWDNPGYEAILPKEMSYSTDAHEILAAYRSYREAKQKDALVQLNEAKLLVVGNEAVGKTSLIRYLVHGRPRDDSEQPTRGVHISERVPLENWAEDCGGVRLNIWDFGGQEIMHGTHKFFLTERSLYLLVIENRYEDDSRSITQWLDTIQSRAPKAPVLVVINKCDEGKDNLRWLNEKRLREEYPSIVGPFLRTSCEETGLAAESITELRGLVAETVTRHEHLKHVRDPIPRSWRRVLGLVREKAAGEQVLNWEIYAGLCRGLDNGDEITDESEQRALLRTLHELGVVVAYGLSKTAPSVLRDISLLDPNWLTNAIYDLLNSRAIWDQGAEFPRSQLSELLDAEDYPTDRHGFILGVMQREDIGLCFRLSDTKEERYLMPEALTPNQPDFDCVWPEDTLRFRYKHNYLPPGLIPRVIVQAHRYLTEQRTAWKTGVLLRIEGCNALLVGDPKRNTIDIKIHGLQSSRRRAALAVLMSEIGRVHGYYSDTPASRQVPLPEQPELDVSHDHLLRLEEKYGLDHEFLPEGAEREYAVRELLEGIPNLGQADRVELDPSGADDARRHSGDIFNAKHIHLHQDKRDMRDDKSVNIGGDVINSQVGQTLNDCTNHIQQNASGETKELLESLRGDIESLIKELPDDKQDEAEDIAEELEDFVNQATKDKPKRRKFDISAEGLLEASAWVKDFSGNITGTLLNLGKKFFGVDYELPEI